MTNTRYPDDLLKIKKISIEMLKELRPHRMYNLFKKSFLGIKMFKGLIPTTILL